MGKLHKLTFDYLGSLERAAITHRAKELRRDDPRRMAFFASADCKYSNRLLQGTPNEALSFTAREFRTALQNKFGVPQSRCLPIAGRPITNHANNTPLRVDVYGYFLRTATSAKYDGIRQLHDSIVNLLSRWLKRANVPHKGGAWGNPQPLRLFFLIDGLLRFLDQRIYKSVDLKKVDKRHKMREIRVAREAICATLTELGICRKLAHR